MDQYERARMKKRRSERMRLFAAYAVLLAVAAAMAFLLWGRYGRRETGVAAQAGAAELFSMTEGAAQVREVTQMERPQLDVQLLTINEYSRPGVTLSQVRGIVIHYTANPGTSAIANRNYFEGLKDTHVTKVSSHFIIGIEGEIVQCIPCGEWAYASNERNEDTISIECCIPDESGVFTNRTYDSLVELTSWLCFRYGLTEKDLLRHHDITGKNCPKYFVEQPGAWDAFREDVADYMEKKRSNE